MNRKEELGSWGPETAGCVGSNVHNAIRGKMQFPKLSERRCEVFSVTTGLYEKLLKPKVDLKGTCKFLGMKELMVGGVGLFSPLAWLAG